MNFFAGGIASLVALIFFVIIRKRSKTKKQLDQFTQNHSQFQLSPEQKRQLVFGAILACYRNEKILDVVPNRSLNPYVKGLKNQWDIYDHSSAIVRLNGLLDLSTSSEYDKFLEEEDIDLIRIKFNIATELGLVLDDVKSVKSTYAWDTSRLASLAKWSYWAGHISEQEMWDYLNKAAQKAGEIGQNWKEYTISFLLGRTIQGFDLDDLIVTTKQLYYSDKSVSDKFPNIDVYEKHDFKS